MLLHQSVWDLTRILEHTVKIAQTFLDIAMVPVHQRRTYLRHYGYAGKLAGLLFQFWSRNRMKALTQFASVLPGGFLDRSVVVSTRFEQQL